MTTETEKSPRDESLKQTRRAGCIWFVGLAIIVLMLAVEIRMLRNRVDALETHIQAVQQEGQK